MMVTGAKDKYIEKDYTNLPYHEVMAMRALREAEWQKRYFVPLFQQLGWHGVHQIDSRQTISSRNALGVRDSALDWMLIRERVIHVELKAEGGYPSKGQKDTIANLIVAKAEVYLWFPRQWHGIVKTLVQKGRERDDV